MENKKMRPGLLITFAGALLAYLIGSGTASGQESVQYFSSWGSVGGTITVAVVNFVVMFCCFMAYTYAGRHGTTDLASVCEFYCGKVVGKISYCTLSQVIAPNRFWKKDFSPVKQKEKMR